MNPLLLEETNQIRDGYLSFFGAFAQQAPRAFLSFNRLLNVHRFDRIIELGTHDGGLSTFFALYAYLSRRPARSSNPSEPALGKNQSYHRRPKDFYTFDIFRRDETMLETLDLLGAHFIQWDTLNNQAAIDSISSLIEDPASGHVLLLCDGGCKKKELELYGSSLKPGDFVMLHDWAQDKATFEENCANGIWHMWETRWEDGEGQGQQFGIRALCETYNIEPMYAEEFDQVAWFCGRKR